MSNFEASYKIILNELQKISGSENFYYKPIKPKLCDLELISLIILAEYKSIDSEHQLFRDLNFENLNFIQMLIKDLRYYHTLCTKSIRRIGAKELSDDKKSIRDFLEEIAYLKQHLGQNYMDDIESRASGRNKEVIIAIENNNLKELL